MSQNAPPDARSDDDTGEVHVIADRYQVHRVLGRGGMGVVYEAENIWTHRRVAIKVLSPERSADPVHGERFVREARATSALRHPNVVDVLDMSQDPRDGALYIVQELLVGEDLRALLEREGKLDEPRVRAIVAPVLRGLAAAHALGIVHRDIKPANVFLAQGPDGALVPKVIDFGIARDTRRDVARTATGQSVGTPAYMAPEQLRAERELTPAVDVWAVGVMLHELLSGELPFPADNCNVLIHQVLAGARPPTERTLSGVSPALRAVIDRALDPSPAARFADASAMLDALDARAPTAPTVPPPRPPSALPRAAAVASLLALVALALRFRAPASPTPARAVAPVSTTISAPAAAPPPVAPRVAEPTVAPPTPTAAPIAPTRAHPHSHAPAAVLNAPDASPARPRAGLLSPGGSYPSP